ncbi:MAG: thiosulfate oxidation carrier complex protein SoxZ [Hyphomicrobiaceae bacterium]
MALTSARIVTPATARMGEIIEIKTLARHPMETGYRRDDRGRQIARDIIGTFRVTYNAVEIFQADLSQGIAANPFIAFTTVAMETGDIIATWTDLAGREISAKARITIT